MSVVITHPENGIFIGEALGVGFWSKLDPAGQTCAVCFRDEKDALEFIATWFEVPEGIEFAKVVPDIKNNGSLYASIQALRNAGLDGWIEERTETANALPI